MHRSPNTVIPAAACSRATGRHQPRLSLAHPDAGWSSPVARQAHNLKVTGSNPVPATILNCRTAEAGLIEPGFFAFAAQSSRMAASSPRSSTLSRPSSGTRRMVSIRLRISSKASCCVGMLRAARPSSATLRAVDFRQIGMEEGARLAHRCDLRGESHPCAPRGP